MPQLKAVRVGAIRSGFVLLTFSRVHQNENGRRRRRRRRKEKEEEKHYGETNNPTILARPRLEKSKVLPSALAVVAGSCVV
jgi:hypothetical protein